MLHQTTASLLNISDGLFHVNTHTCVSYCILTQICPILTHLPYAHTHMPYTVGWVKSQYVNCASVGIFHLLAPLSHFQLIIHLHSFPQAFREDALLWDQPFTADLTHLPHCPSKFVSKTIQFISIATFIVATTLFFCRGIHNYHLSYDMNQERLRPAQLRRLGLHSRGDHLTSQRVEVIFNDLCLRTHQ